MVLILNISSSYFQILKCPGAFIFITKPYVSDITEHPLWVGHCENVLLVHKLSSYIESKGILKGRGKPSGRFNKEGNLHMRFILDSYKMSRSPYPPANS